MAAKINNLGTCEKCHGTGRIERFSNIAQGLCFRCAGSGQIGRVPTQSAPNHKGQTNEGQIDGYDVYDYDIWSWTSFPSVEMARKCLPGRQIYVVRDGEREELS